MDETSLKTNMAKATGWAPKGARLIDHLPFGHSLPGNGQPVIAQKPWRGSRNEECRRVVSVPLFGENAPLGPFLIPPTLIARI